MKRLHVTDGLIAFGLSTLFTALSIITSLHTGVLSVPPTFDDISYFDDAAARLLMLQQNGLWVFLSGFIANPPHAPIVTCTDLIAFVLFGLHPWAVYMLNGIWVFILLLGLRWYFYAQPLYLYLITAIAVLAWPLTGYLVLEGRPDIVCGFLTALGCLMILSRPWIEAPPRWIVASGLIAGLALWTKPSIILVTLVLYGCACIFSSIADYAAHRHRHMSVLGLVRPTAIFSLTALLTALPYYIFGWRPVFAYIYINYVGANKAVWIKASAMPNWDGTIFYLWGIGGHRTMGGWFFITILLLIAAGALHWQTALKHRAKLAAIAAWFIIMYLSVTIPTVKSPYLGVSVSCTVFFLFLAALRSSFTVLAGDRDAARARVVTIAASALLLGLSVTQFHWHGYYYTGGLRAMGNPDMTARRFTLIDKLADTIATTMPQGGFVYLPTATQYLNSSVLQFALYQRHIGSITIGDLSFSDNVAAHLAAISRVSDVVLLDPADPELIPFLPGSSVVGPVADALKHDPTMQCVASFTAADGVHHILVYHRQSKG